jgi:hypothetical protein
VTNLGDLAFFSPSMIALARASCGSQLGAIYANLFPGRVRAMVSTGHWTSTATSTGHG